MPVRFDVDPPKIIDAKIKTGGGAKGIANAIRNQADKYVPFDTGTLKNTALVTGGPYSAELTYIQPYARYQYYGKVMAGKMPRKVTGRNLTYGGGRLRGPFWIDRAVQAGKNGRLKYDIELITGGKMKWES